MQVGEAQLVEFGHQVAVKRRAFRAFVDAAQRVARRQADRRAVGADFRGDGLGDFDREARATQRFIEFLRERLAR